MRWKTKTCKSIEFNKGKKKNKKEKKGNIIEYWFSDLYTVEPRYFEVPREMEKSSK